MCTNCRSHGVAASVALLLLACSVVAAPPSSLSLRQDFLADQTKSDMLSRQDTEDATSDDRDDDDSLVLSGPYFLRSATPEEVGEAELKFIYGYEKPSHGEEEHEFEFVFEWGVAEDLEFILELPVTLGEGRVEGNGDITQLGFHIRHWREDGLMPAFATRHLLRIPTGYHSNGVDYLLRGLFTKTLVPGSVHLHFNPFLKSLNGNLEEDTRRFQWGAAIGFDYRLRDDLILIADYQHVSSEEYGARNQHSLEFGADWEIAEDRMLGFQTAFGIDGDDHGSDFEARISYIIELDMD